jgi:hypothetical protein
VSQTRLLTDAIAALDGAGVGYLLSGSLASSLQGEPRATHDIDLVIEVDARIVSALAQAFGTDPYFFDESAARNALDHRRMFNLIDTVSGDKIDFWPLTDEPFDVSRFSRRVHAIVFGIDIAVSSPEDTILQKLRWAVACGGSERQVNDAAGVYGFQSGGLDESYLDHWAGILGVADLLAEIRGAAAD